MLDPIIVLAGRRWPVPFLAPRQNRVVVPLLLNLGEGLAERYQALLDIVFASLTRAHPHLSRKEFEHLPIATHELFDALPVIAKQTGLLGTARNAHRSPFEEPDWDSIIAECVTLLPGTTWTYWEDELTVPRLESLREEWRRCPPLAVLAAAWLGYRPRPRDEETLQELMRLFPNGQLRLN